MSSEHLIPINNSYLPVIKHGGLMITTTKSYLPVVNNFSYTEDT